MKRGRDLAPKKKKGSRKKRRKSRPSPLRKAKKRKKQPKKPKAPRVKQTGAFSVELAPKDTIRNALHKSRGAFIAAFSKPELSHTITIKSEYPPGVTPESWAAERAAWRDKGGRWRDGKGRYTSVPRIPKDPKARARKIRKRRHAPKRAFLPELPSEGIIVQRLPGSPWEIVKEDIIEALRSWGFRDESPKLRKLFKRSPVTFHVVIHERETGPPAELTPAQKFARAFEARMIQKFTGPR